MFTLGLTGGIGSGKSTAAEFFCAQQIDVLDLDRVARDLVDTNAEVSERIQAYFGSDILDENSQLDRQKLAAIVFSQPEQKRWLESLLHPLIRQQQQQFIARSQSAYVVVEIPLLAEKGLQGSLDRVLVIDCDMQLQLQRAVQRGQQSEQHIKAIIAAQASREQRNAIADDIVLNQGSKQQLADKLAGLHAEYLQLAGCHRSNL